MISDAQKILDVEIFPDMKKEEISAINERYSKQYEKNSWIKGSRTKPTYLQSRIYRAKERIDQELVKLGNGSGVKT